MSDTTQELRALLARAELGDLEQLAAVLDRWPRPEGLVSALTLARSSHVRRPLEIVLARSLLRDATGEITWAARRLVRSRSADDLHDALTRAGKKLHLLVPFAGTFTGRAAALASAFVDRTVRAMSPEEQQQIVSEALARAPSITTTAAPTLAPAVALPVLHATLGSAALLQLSAAIVAEATRTLLGREVARAATSAIFARASLVSTALGPLAWGASAALLGWQLQGPADRKVIPALLCLGVVAMRPASVSRGREDPSLS